MTSKINIAAILREHFLTLRKQDQKCLSKADFLIFYFIPLSVALFAVLGLGHRLTNDGANFLIAMFSIFIGLLLNLLVLIFGVLQANSAKSTQNEDDSRRRTLLRETFSNISYSILISFILLVLLFVARISAGTVLTVFVVVIYAIIGNFLLTLLMVLKRVHALLSVEAR